MPAVSLTRIRAVRTFVCLQVCLVFSSVAAEDHFHKAIGSAFKSHCIKCHGVDGEINGDVDLLQIPDSKTLESRAELLRLLIDVIEKQEMPPEDEPALDSETRKQVLSALRESFDRSLAQQNSIGQAPIRRMNRFQYNNAVTDLFKLNCVVFTLPERMARVHKNYFQPASGKMPETVSVGSRPLGKSQLIEPRLAGVAAFPQDLRAEHGFDNRGDHLSLSPLLMESFLQLSQSITQSPDFGPRRVGIWESFFEPPGEVDETVVRERLKAFLTQAFRRQADSNELDRYTGFVVGQLKRGTHFTDAMKAAAAAVLASPKFLYLYDQGNHKGRPSYSAGSMGIGVAVIVLFVGKCSRRRTFTSRRRGKTD